MYYVLLNDEYQMYLGDLVGNDWTDATEDHCLWAGEMLSWQPICAQTARLLSAYITGKIPS